MARDNGAAAALLGLGLGLWWFYRGFRHLRLKRMVQGMATSKARSVAMGMVELYGQARPAKPMNDPVYGQPCAHYSIEVKEQRRSSKSTHWVTVFRDNSDPIPFYLEDDTGKVLIFAQGARLYFERDIDLVVGGILGDSPVERFLRRFGGPFTTLQLKASFLHEYDPLYCLGYVVNAENPLTLREKVVKRAKLTLAEIARGLKADPALMKAADLNRDGTIDAQEWDESLRRYQAEIRAAEAQEEAKALLSKAPADRVFLVRKHPQGFFVLADRPKKELVGRLGGMALLQAVVGPILAVACAVYLAGKLGVFG